MSRCLRRRLPHSVSLLVADGAKIGVAEEGVAICAHLASFGRHLEILDGLGGGLDGVIVSGLCRE